jgi:hypothetical protein
LADEGTAAIGSTQRRTIGECQPEGGGVGAERIVGFDFFLDQIHAWRLGPNIYALTVVAVGSAVKAAVRNGDLVSSERARRRSRRVR